MNTFNELMRSQVEAIFNIFDKGKVKEENDILKKAEKLAKDLAKAIG